LCLISPLLIYSCQKQLQFLPILAR
jgi:hypothetical protein